MAVPALQIRRQQCIEVGEQAPRLRRQPREPYRRVAAGRDFAGVLMEVSQQSPVAADRCRRRQQPLGQRSDLPLRDGIVGRHMFREQRQGILQAGQRLRPDDRPVAQGQVALAQGQ